MGWSSGSILFDNVIRTIFEHVEDHETRKFLYADLIYSFEEADCDTLYECVGKDPAFDELWKEINAIGHNGWEE